MTRLGAHDPTIVCADPCQDVSGAHVERSCAPTNVAGAAVGDRQRIDHRGRARRADETGGAAGTTVAGRVGRGARVLRRVGRGARVAGRGCCGARVLRGALVAGRGCCGAWSRRGGCGAVAEHVGRGVRQLRSALVAGRGGNGGRWGNGGRGVVENGGRGANGGRGGAAATVVAGVVAAGARRVWRSWGGVVAVVRRQRWSRVWRSRGVAATVVAGLVVAGRGGRGGCGGREARRERRAARHRLQRMLEGDGCGLRRVVGSSAGGRVGPGLSRGWRSCGDTTKGVPRCLSVHRATPCPCVGA
ncbi:hypothetical protein BC793_11795 [Actinoplanes xinjiangensis]|uniref:Uncharacterized protein n=1 Tax=Actinoplanes xinjiangensis TaxID=512350 RepID=A0A316FQK3_9ACTN|nr:hypothetical protein BC793_11795 [Actinoplanes xinjiangensis]